MIQDSNKRYVKVVESILRVQSNLWLLEKIKKKQMFFTIMIDSDKFTIAIRHLFLKFDVLHSSCSGKKPDYIIIWNEDDGIHLVPSEEITFRRSVTNRRITNFYVKSETVKKYKILDL